ncbi:MAG: DNA polymerase IV [Spirochaetales bacterium]|nr:DNA polymerase IV [Spirochaetales bacterium]MCF7937855.1 DNA polymerase IV [Spirochaetales bacterium]
MSKVIFHVDLDAFYASVEQLDNPELRGKPVIVGGQSRERGVVSACSYEAREFGVHSAMPSARAAALCPKGIFLPVRMQRYQAVSKVVMELLSEQTPVFHQVSVDEAFLDMSGTQRLVGEPLEFAQSLKSRVQERIGLNISIGIAENYYLAKLCSDYKKPNGLFRLDSDQVEEFLDQLPLEKLWGIGKKSKELLNTLNIHSVSDLRRVAQEYLESRFGKAGGSFLYRACRGIDPGIWTRKPKSRSMSSERTFPEDINNPEILERFLLELSEEVFFRLLDNELVSNTVFIKVRYHDFSTHTAQTTLNHPVHSSKELFEYAKKLLEKYTHTGLSVRLLGCGCSNLYSLREEAGDLFEESENKRGKVEQAIGKLRKKYHSIPIERAGFLNTDYDKKNTD